MGPQLVLSHSENNHNPINICVCNFNLQPAEAVKIYRHKDVGAVENTIVNSNTTKPHTFCHDRAHRINSLVDVYADFKTKLTKNSA